MGKFFVAGVFLGAAVTFSVMHFMKEKSFTADELKKKVDDERTSAAAKSAGSAEREWQGKLNDAEARLTAKHEAALAKRDSAAAGLAAEKKAAEDRLAEVVRRTKGLADENAKLKERLASAASSGRSSDAPKGLLARRAGLLQAGVRLWRTLGEVNASLEQAAFGWCDVDAVHRRAKALPGLAADYAKKAQEVKTFLEENSASLGRDLGDLEPFRGGVRREDTKAINALIEKIQTAVEGIKSASVTVPAKKDGWTDTEVYVKKGDVVQVRAEGRWKMVEHWPPAGPEGWEAGAQHKIAPNARAGALILRISVSENMSPAYLGMPIPADREGRIVLRMNDKTVSENGGRLAAKVFCISPTSLAKAVAEWRRLVGE